MRLLQTIGMVQVMVDFKLDLLQPTKSNYGQVTVEEVAKSVTDQGLGRKC